jgi:SOS-response transcriptional repressor LexA
MGLNPAMDEKMSERIDELLKKLGKKASRASVEAGMGKDFIRDLRRRPVRPGAESLSRLAQTLKTTPEFLLYGKTGGSILPVEGLPIIGVVEAGQFRDITLADQDEEFATVNVVRDRRYPHARQYALLVSGDSMNKKFDDGTYAICVSFPETGLALKSGMIVHVERSIAGTQLVETTLKAVEMRGRKCFLVPLSTNLKHKEIEISQEHEDDEVTQTRVQGLVVGSYKPVEF